ncbi:metal dependent phosphohydrolase [Pedococcus cremeus]|uniref:Metal dependent phosphohydrolase n=1 Tax=Pedococcus cremeus TaxID=587636 RepID=A0A1H9XHS0_9MICO|nr:HD domain-containing protein [Pedococcus cremeus]SES45720.1 metal dependent phosphohydrolase [Pedococcus cremeus]
MGDATLTVYADLMAGLTPTRQRHSVEVGRKVASRAVQWIDPALRADVISAALLHDIGYAHPNTGMHAIDGAAFLRRHGFRDLVCHLVAHHSCSHIEAAVRGLPESVYEPYSISEARPELHRLITWADMTTGPTGETVTVEERLAEIESRYGEGDPVTEFIARARAELLAAGQSPSGSM